MNQERLEELRRAMSDFEAPARIKPAVLEAFRARKRKPAVYRWGAIAACAALIAAGLYWSWPRPVRAPELRVSAPKTPPLLVTSTEHERRAPRRRLSRAPHRQPRETATGFFALPFAAPLSPEDAVQVVRVTLPRSAMRSVGLPVNEERLYERVPADVVLGQDGIARAVRFVKYAQ
jgi:hypothetical protein